jgi:large subunit ribosomal protein L25
MKSVSLTVYPRTQCKRTGSRKVRAASRLPAVIYGRHNEPQSLEIGMVEFQKLIKHSVSENILVDLDVQGDPRSKRLALVQEVQHHALTAKLLHVDFHEVAPDEKVAVTVPVETVGIAAGVKSGGGVLEKLLFKLKVFGLPKDLPEILAVDVSHLEIGQSIHIGDIPTTPGVEILGNKKISVIAVAAPITEAQETEAAAAAVPGEPEMIREKKEDEGAAPAKSGEKAPGKAPEKAAEGKPAAAEKKAEKKK